MPEQDPLSTGFYETSVAKIAQGAAGATTVATPAAGQKVYVTGIFVTLDAAGTIKFGETAGDLTGTLNVGGTSAPPLAVTNGSHPILWTTTAGEALTLTTATGKAQGWITFYTA